MRYNLSEITEIIQDRRTIFPEQFSDRKVAKEIIENIVKNATWAPNHGKTQPWRFNVFTGDGKIGLKNMCAELYKSETAADAFTEAKYVRIQERIDRTSAIITVWMKRDESHKISESDEMMAVACAVQNLMLSATAYGIGSFWSTPKFINTTTFKNWLKIAPDDMVIGNIYLGYPTGDWPTAHRKPIEYVTQWIDK